MSFVVSIHAPTWGATDVDVLRKLEEVGFQSTHPRGVRQGRCRHFDEAEAFQSTHPRGVRLMPDARRLDQMCVSIHAPTWGATAWLMRHSAPALFQSTHPRGVRLPYFSTLSIISGFQSTHPRGVRHIFSKYLNIILQKYINCEQHANF